MNNCDCFLFEHTGNFHFYYREGNRGGPGMDSQQQQYCLKWNSFGSNLATSFANLWNSESLADVTLYCEGELFRSYYFIEISVCETDTRSTSLIGYIRNKDGYSQKDHTFRLFILKLLNKRLRLYGFSARRSS